MKLMYVNRALLLATSAAALSFAAPIAAAQQPQPTTAPKAQPAAQAGQQDLQQSIRSLEQARDRLGSAQQGQMTEARTQARQALERVETQLSGKDAAQQAMKSIDSAKETLQRPQFDRQAASQSLDRVIAEVKTVQQQMTEGPNRPDQRMGQAGQSTDIQVGQKSPQVSVQQPAPQVTVKQPAPQVTVQQPQPKVTVEQPQPKVTVEQAKPKVSVEQQGKPQVTVQQQDNAKVTVERPGDPRIAAQNETTAKPGPMTQEQDKAHSRSETPQTTAQNQTTVQGRDTEQERQVAALGQGLVGKELYSADNRSMGEVENIVMGQNDRIESVLVDVGGFLGIGARRVAIPISRIKLQGDRLTTTMTEAQAKELPEHTAQRR